MSYLDQNTILIYKALKNTNTLKMSYLIKETRLDEITILKTLYWLAEKDIIAFRFEKDFVFVEVIK